MHDFTLSITVTPKEMCDSTHDQRYGLRPVHTSNKVAENGNKLLPETATETATKSPFPATLLLVWTGLFSHVTSQTLGPAAYQQAYLWDAQLAGLLSGQ